MRTRNDIGQLLNESYRYDKLGNLTAKDSLGIGYGSILTGTYPHRARSVGGQAYTYDANGSLVNGGGRAYT